MLVLLMLMFFQRHNKLYNKENDIPMVLLKIHWYGNCANETTDD